MYRWDNLASNVVDYTLANMNAPLVEISTASANYTNGKVLLAFTFSRPVVDFTSAAVLARATPVPALVAAPSAADKAAEFMLNVTDLVQLDGGGEFNSFIVII